MDAAHVLIGEAGELGGGVLLAHEEVEEAVVPGVEQQTRLPRAARPTRIAACHLE